MVRRISLNLNLTALSKAGRVCFPRDWEFHLVNPIAFPVIILAGFLAASPVMAKVNISISETTRMNWGTVGIPSSGSQYLTLSPSNSSVTGTGHVLLGTPSRGVYNIRGVGGGSTSITIDISNVSTGSSYLTLDSFTGIYSSVNINSFPSPTLPLPSPSGTPLYLGARATMTSSLSPGALHPTFDVVVIVQ
jgi:hypothetical protein